MGRMMQKSVACGLCLVLVVVALSGCVSLEQQVSEHPGTAIGAGTGAAGGALLGGLVFQSTTGAVIGGLVGGLAGGLIGNAVEARKQDEQTTNQEYGYHTNQGVVVRIEEVRVQPAQIRPGGSTNLIVQYALMTPRPYQEVTVAEQWDMSYKGQNIGNPVHTVRHAGGTWAGAIPVTLPASAGTGTYRVAVTVEANGIGARREASFTVRR